MKMAHAILAIGIKRAKSMAWVICFFQMAHVMVKTFKLQNEKRIKEFYTQMAHSTTAYAADWVLWILQTDQSKNLLHFNCGIICIYLSLSVIADTKVNSCRDGFMVSLLYVVWMKFFLNLILLKLKSPHAFLIFNYFFSSSFS